LKNVHERLFKPKEAEKGRKAKTNKKAQKEEDKPADAQAEEPNPMDVFVDILVALLHRRNATLREVVKSVFTAFATDVTVNGLQILIDVVTQPIEESKAEEDEEDGEIDFGSDAGSDTMEESKGGEDGDEDAEDDENADDGEDGDSDVSMNDDGSDADSIDDEQESEEDLMDDEEMLANDDKLAAVMREYKARASASSNFLHDQMTIKFKALDLLDIMVRRNASLPQRSSILVATLVPLLQALRRLAAPSASTQKTDLVDPLFARMKSLLVHRICHNKHLLENAQDATVVETVMKGVFDFVKHCSFRSVSSIAWTCLCFVMKLSKAIDEEHKQAVRIASYALKDMMLRKSTHLLPAQFKDLMSRFPTTIGKSLTVALLTYISEDKAKKFKRQQAITLVEGVFHSELKNRTLDTETLRAIAERLPGLFSRYTEEIKSAPAKKAKLVSKGIAITVQFVHNVLKEADGVDLKSSVAAARALSQASEKIPQLVTSVEQLSSTYKLNEDTNDEDAVMVDAQKEKKKKKQAKK
jgi:CRISPR/Cas system CMR-associated protein Cmr5 small subunit